MFQTLSYPVIYFQAGTIGTQTSKYISGEVAGTEIIKAQVQGGNDISEFRINVKVPDLYNMGVSDSYRLTGQSQTHPFNHYGTWETLTRSSLIADDFYEHFGATLGINDISLEWGGMFDICGTFNVGDGCANALGGGHKSHRNGTGVDIDRCALYVTGNNPNQQGDCPTGYIKVNKRYVEEKCWEFGRGKIAKEATIHCEFSY